MQTLKIIPNNLIGGSQVQSSKRNQADNKSSSLKINPLSIKRDKIVSPHYGSLINQAWSGPPVFMDYSYLGRLQGIMDGNIQRNRSIFDIQMEAEIASLKSQLYQDKVSTRRVQDSIDRAILKNNIIVIGDVIEDNLANEVRQKTMLLAATMNKRGKIKPVHFLINSPGGSIISLYSILDAMDRLKNTKINGENIVVSTFCDGWAASAASVIFANGTPGYRYMSPRSYVMIHQPLGGGHGQASELDIGNKLIQDMKQDLRDFYVKTTKLDKETVEKIMDRDSWLRASTCLEYGIADGIDDTFLTEQLNEMNLKELNLLPDTERREQEEQEE